ncbi:hypothetical protein [Paenibacillus xerothermodurans]|uniref:Uncharacterized protein n=1 Tax=Paenibacillus xerothermodurans TaxID=1977292 RepID=A0A2W1N9S4_PAEXE|nr:hypothetical protein [Paenibacillus xerothermodurans]PZE20684.1 hypothetical protein CBW46_010930 [Paenibacillus xerothermodurans]
MADRIEVRGLPTGTKVKVYTSATVADAIAAETVGEGSSTAVVSVPQLGPQAGFIYVTATSQSEAESARVIKAYASERASSSPERANIKIDT